MEIWLSLDLSWATGTLALHSVKNDVVTLIDDRTLGEEHNHSERLMGALEAVLREKGIGLDKVGRFVTTSGPGSFTGLRIAYATLKAFVTALPRPVEILSGSEARAIAWSRKQPRPLPYDDICVFTHASMDKFVRATFDSALVPGRESVISASSITMIGEGKKAYLVDKPSSAAMIPSDESTTVEVFPLKAAYLGETLLAAKSRVTYTKLEEWIGMSPQYFGDTRY